MREKHQLNRDLPEPPQQSEENYAAALAEVYRALDEAEMVAPDEAGREFVDQVRDRVRGRMLERIEDVSEEEVSDDG